MIWGGLFLGLLVAGIVLALRYGAREERYGVMIVVANAVLTYVVILLGSSLWEGVEFAVLLVDFATLFAFGALANGSNRFWPLWVTGLQLAQITTHLARMADTGLLPKAYEAGQGLWAWLQILVIVGSALQARAVEKAKRSRG